MCPDDPKTCRRIQTAIKLFIRPDSPKLDPQIFIHSLPSPIPKDKPEIIDLILQVILLLIEQLKPDNGNANGNGDTNFPNLERQARHLAREHVDATTLSATAHMFSDSIALTVHNLTLNPPPSIRVARETMRRANHAALGPDVHSWHTWNEDVRTILDTHADFRRLTTITHYLDAWTQISKGLEIIT
jgi:hypothetical protein